MEPPARDAAPDRKPPRPPLEGARSLTMWDAAADISSLPHARTRTNRAPNRAFVRICRDDHGRASCSAGGGGRFGGRGFGGGVGGSAGGGGGGGVWGGRGGGAGGGGFGGGGGRLGGRGFGGLVGGSAGGVAEAGL